MAASQHAPLSINSQQNASPRSELRNQGIDPHVAHASCSAGASSTGASSTGAGSGGICSGGASGAGDGSGGICSGSGGICSGSGGICSGGASSAGVCSAGACTAAPWYAEPCSAAPTAARLCAEHGEGHWERAGAGGQIILQGRFGGWLVRLWRTRSRKNSNRLRRQQSRGCRWGRRPRS